MRIEAGNICMILDPNDENFGQAHARMIEDFQDVEKLAYFKTLLLSNSDCAFELYLQYINFTE